MIPRLILHAARIFSDRNFGENQNVFLFEQEFFLQNLVIFLDDVEKYYRA
jgi:hypothetical protein